MIGSNGATSVVNTAQAVTLGSYSIPDASSTIISRVLSGIAERSQEYVTSFGAAPSEYLQLSSALASFAGSGDGIRAFTYVLIMLTVGVGIELYYWAYAYSALRSLLNLEPSSPRDTLRFSARRVWLTGFGLFLFGTATLATTAAFSWPAQVYDATVRLTLLLVAIRGCLLILDVIISPKSPQLRLVPISNERAWYASFALKFLVALVFITWFVPALIERFPNAANLASAVRLALGTIVATSILVIAVQTTNRPSPSFQDIRHGVLPKFSISMAATALIVIIYGLWVFDFTTTALLMTILLATVAIQMPMRSMVFYFWRDEVMTGNVSRDGPVEDEEPVPALAPSIILSIVRLCGVLAGIIACATAADLPVLGAATSDSPMARLGVRLLEVAALGLSANVLWIITRTSIDHRLAGLSPELEQGRSPSSRLLTLLPILRMTALVVIGVMLVLSSLWTLGLEITPLLAGAGVVGLAFGFGAQSLVKDVITGVFYLAEDTFRIGEYIESGSSTKGTVEKLTLRTVALRHHNGPVHFVPYGTLGTVRNTSRDWVVEKFNLPLPLEVDSERIRKLIKRIGEAMLDDPELGPLIIEPLKGKLSRIDPGVKIFRCSFKTAPGNQFEVRAAAYKRIEGALNEAGITFAGTQLTPPKPPGPGNPP